MTIAVFYKDNKDNAEFVGMDKYCILDGRFTKDRQILYCFGYNIKFFGSIGKNAKFVRIGKGRALSACIDNARNSPYIKL